MFDGIHRALPHFVSLQSLRKFDFSCNAAYHNVSKALGAQFKHIGCLTDLNLESCAVARWRMLDLSVGAEYLTGLRCSNKNISSFNHDIDLVGLETILRSYMLVTSVPIVTENFRRSSVVPGGAYRRASLPASPTARWKNLFGEIHFNSVCPAFTVGQSIHARTRR